MTSHPNSPPTPHAEGEGLLREALERARYRLQNAVTATKGTAEDAERRVAFKEYEAAVLAALSLRTPPAPEREGDRTAQLVSADAQIEAGLPQICPDCGAPKATPSSPSTGPLIAILRLHARPDGGLRVCSDDVPGLVLSGVDPESVGATILPALRGLGAPNVDQLLPASGSAKA